MHSTTILSVRQNGTVVIAGDGQVTLGDTIMKSSARKVRRLYSDRVIAGFAGSSADAIALFQRFRSEARAVSRTTQHERQLSWRRTGAPTR